jgi:hypothetical protein
MHAPLQLVVAGCMSGPAVPVTAGFADDDTCQRQWPCRLFRCFAQERLGRRKTHGTSNRL